MAKQEKKGESIKIQWWCMMACVCVCEWISIFFWCEIILALFATSPLFNAFFLWYLISSKAMSCHGIGWICSWFGGLSYHFRSICSLAPMQYLFRFFNKLSYPLLPFPPSFIPKATRIVQSLLLKMILLVPQASLSTRLNSQIYKIL